MTESNPKENSRFVVSFASGESSSTVEIIMLIVSMVRVQDKLDILIGLVIAAIVITAGYVGYHASQETHETEKHGIPATPHTSGDTSVYLYENAIVIPARI